MRFVFQNGNSRDGYSCPYSCPNSANRAAFLGIFLFWMILAQKIHPAIVAPIFSDPLDGPGQIH
jgi:hypothetical protein